MAEARPSPLAFLAEAAALDGLAAQAFAVSLRVERLDTPAMVPYELGACVGELEEMGERLFVMASSLRRTAVSLKWNIERSEG